MKITFPFSLSVALTTLLLSTNFPVHTFAQDYPCDKLEPLLALSDDELWNLGLDKKVGLCYIARSSGSACNYYVKGPPSPLTGHNGVPRTVPGDMGTGCVKDTASSFCYFNSPSYGLTPAESASMCTSNVVANAAAQLRYGIENGYCCDEKSDAPSEVPSPTPPTPTPPTHPPEVHNSHLVCRRARNKTFKGKTPVANFVANLKQKRYSIKQCKINLKVVELCVPSTKKVKDFDGIQYPQILLQVEAQYIGNDFLCYNMKCAGKDNAPKRQFVADQFGTKLLEFVSPFGRYRVCVPAWKINKNGPIVIGKA